MTASPAGIRGWRLRPLAACLALAFDAHAATSHLVTTCADSDVPPTCDGVEDGTLRKAYSCAQDFDTIDLTTLQCSTITLSAPLTGGSAHLSLYGPGKDALSIDGAGKFRVMVHAVGASGLLGIHDLTITNGAYANAKGPGSGSGGGCIYSSANVTLTRSTVSNCSASATQNDVNGGGVYAKHDVSLTYSTVTGNSVTSTAGSSEGAGIWGASISINGSTISGNTAQGASYTLGGGIFANADLGIIYSTVSGNDADIGAGAWGRNVYLSNSTVAGNHAATDAAVYAVYRAKVRFSTIAGNTGGPPGFLPGAVGLYLAGGDDIELHSSIIANNTRSAAVYDVGAFLPATISGSNNLITTHSLFAHVPADTIAADPKLGPLQDNGGPTQTLALLPGSPATDRGDDAGGAFPFDQRRFERKIGKSADIGAFESDDLFGDGFDP